MKVNTYGYKMVGLKAASGESKGLRGYYSGEYVELFYSPADGTVWTKYQYSLGQNSWTVYDDPDVIKICNISQPATMQQLADLIANSMGQMDIAV